MQPPQEPHTPESQMQDMEAEFGRSLADVERSLVALKQRYVQVQNDLKLQAKLQQRLNQVKKLPKTQLTNNLRIELQQIQEQLEAIETNLESQLFSWGSLREPFWQAVRFGGLGVVVGWILKSCTK